MGYYIKKLDAKLKTPKWKVQFVSYKKEDWNGSPAKNPKKEWDVPRHQWSELGFNPSMTLEQAKARASQLNAQAQSKLFEARQQRFLRAKKEFEHECRAIIPEFFREPFEKQFGTPRSFTSNHQSSKAHWHAAQKILYKLAPDPSDWFECSHESYEYFATQRLSLSYSRKILRFVNLWGFYISKKLGKPFMPVPVPRGLQKKLIQEAY